MKTMPRSWCGGTRQLLVYSQTPVDGDTKYCGNSLTSSGPHKERQLCVLMLSSRNLASSFHSSSAAAMCPRPAHSSCSSFVIISRLVIGRARGNGNDGNGLCVVSAVATAPDCDCADRSSQTVKARFIAAASNEDEGEGR